MCDAWVAVGKVRVAWVARVMAVGDTWVAAIVDDCFLVRDSAMSATCIMIVMHVGITAAGSPKAGITVHTVVAVARITVHAVVTVATH